MSHDGKPNEGKDTAWAKTLEQSVLKSAFPAALRNYELKVAHQGKPKLVSEDPDDQHEQFYCMGYVSAIYDMMIGQIEIECHTKPGPLPEPMEPKRVILLKDL